VSNQYWFAALNRKGYRNPRMTPISREGWLVVAGFVLSMLVGALLFAALMLTNHVALAVIVFALFAITGASGFLWASVAKGDTTRTVAEYRAMRKGTTI
jgi:hypothetical protein